jgi:hypothetical protein
VAHTSKCGWAISHNNIVSSLISNKASIIRVMWEVKQIKSWV